MSFESELIELIKRHLPETVTICTGKVTYPQTLETPVEYGEVEVELDHDAFIDHYTDIIDELIMTVNDAEDCCFVDKIEREWQSEH